MTNENKIIDGKLFAEGLRARIAVLAADFAEKAGRKAGLAVVLVGEDPASQVYVRGKVAACARTGVKSLEYRLPADTGQAQLDQLIAQLCQH